MSTKAEFGSRENPVKCKGVQGERAYLDNLFGPDGKPVIYRRVGSSSQSPGIVLDLYEVRYDEPSDPFIIYFNMYAKGPSDKKPVKGFYVESHFLKPKPWQKIGYIDLIAKVYYSGQALNISQSFFYLHSKAGFLLAQGPYIYARKDFFGLPSTFWDLNALMNCTKQLVHELKGLTAKRPLEVSATYIIQYFFETFHFEIIDAGGLKKKGLIQVITEHSVSGQKLDLWFDVG